MENRVNKAYTLEKPTETSSHDQKTKTLISAFEPVDILIVVISVAASMLLALILLTGVEYSYRVSNELLIQAPWTEDAERDSQTGKPAFHEAQKDVLLSQRLAQKVVLDLNLIERYSANTSLLASHHGYLPVFSETSNKLPTAATRNASYEKMTIAEKQHYLAKRLLNNASTTGEKSDYVIVFSYDNVDPKFTSEVVNAFTSAFVTFTYDAQLENIKRAEKWFLDESDSLLLQIKNVKRRLQIVEQQEAKIQENGGDTKAQSRPSTVSQHDVLTSLIGDIQESQGTNTSIGQRVSVEQLANDSAVRPALETFMQQQNTVNAYFDRYREKHPKMIAARATLAKNEVELRAAVESRLDNYIGTTSSDTSTSYASNPLSSAFLGDTVSALQEEVKQAQRNYDEFQQQGQSIVQLAKYEVPLVTVLNPASPAEKVKPQTVVALVLSGILGIAIALSIILFKHRKTGRVRTTKDIEKRTDIQSLGAVQSYSRKSNPQLPECYYLKRPKSSYVGDIDRIRDKLLHTNIESPPKVILITSTESSRAASELALNLSASFAKTGKTLLIETNLRHAIISKVLNSREHSGFSDVLAGSVPLDDAIFTVKGTKQMHVLDGGTLPQKPLHFLKSDKLDAIIETLKSEFDTVVLACPPCVDYPDTSYLLRHVDGVVMTERASLSRLDNIEEAISSIKEHHGDIMGVVLLEHRRAPAKR